MRGRAECARSAELNIRSHAQGAPDLTHGSDTSSAPGQGADRTHDMDVLRSLRPEATDRVSVVRAGG